MQIANCKMRIAESDRVGKFRCRPRRFHICSIQFAICIAQFLLLIHAAEYGKALAAGPKPPGQQAIIDRTPFDKILLNQTGGGATLEVLPLNLPQRPLAVVPTTGSIKVRLLTRPTEEFEVNWANVAAVRVFEQVLMDEADRLATAGKFDEAYDYYVRLRVDFPSFPGLEDAICNYLRQNSLALYQAKQHDRALAILLTLYQRNPTYPSLPSAVEAVAGEVIQRYLKDGNYAAARRVLDLWQTQFRNIAAQSAAGWQQRFESAAGKQVAEANQLIGRRDYVGARKAAVRALSIWPTLNTAEQAMARIEREFPFVTVAVSETSPRTPVRRIDDWASLRTSVLTERMLAEEVDFGSEGGIYASPFGEWRLDDSGRDLTLTVNATPAAGAPTPDALARYMLSMATTGSPTYRADLAALLDGISIRPGNTIAIHLKRVHVRPESMMQVAIPSATAGGLYRIADFAPDQVVFAKQGATGAGGPQAIVEQTMANDEAAVTALMDGTSDILDRVPPWHLARLRAIEEVRVESYQLPTVHVLIPNLKKPLLAKREFRRALCFGIDRKWIVDRVLLGGTPQPGFEVISAPFPTGTSLNDPIRYAYNSQVAPRPFEPRLAAILASVAWNSVQNPPDKNKDKKKDAKGGAEKKPEPVETPIPELTLAHPNDPVARVACQSIQAQLVRQGISTKLVEFTADDLLAGKVECDLRYAELAVWEPIADARLIFGPQGLVGDLQSPYLDAALRNLDTATNWKDARARLSELHEIVSHELPVIPLWQTINFFAYRASVRGIGEAPITLYRNVEQWNSAPRANVAQAGAGGSQ